MGTPFKMKGYTYPGQSPVKGKQKQQDLATAAAARTSGYEKLQEQMGGGSDFQSTNLLEGKPVEYGQSPVTKKEPSTPDFNNPNVLKAYKENPEFRKHLKEKGITYDPKTRKSEKVINK